MLRSQVMVSERSTDDQIMTFLLETVIRSHLVAVLNLSKHGDVHNTEQNQDYELTFINNL